MADNHYSHCICSPCKVLNNIQCSMQNELMLVSQIFFFWRRSNFSLVDWDVILTNNHEACRTRHLDQ
uniref:Uncharacterized protein n=1 Tax=Arundo donax TaxID=35708 RepID=A0A0A9GEJ9_ARUDO